MDELNIIKNLANLLRIDCIEMIYNAGSGHIGGSLSCAEIISVLYSKYMNINPDKPDDQERDRFILSKGHAAPILYAMLARKGYISKDKLSQLRVFGSLLQGHPCMFKMPGIDMSTGSLGMGISVGVGMALAARLQNKSYHTYVLCGDGEMNEGQNWEGIMSANKWKLNNLTIIVDRNHVQLDGTEDEIMPMGDLGQKISSFGLNVLECDGHDVSSLMYALERATKNKESTTAIIAQTIKGKGISFMEGKAEWHGKKLNLRNIIKLLKK